MAQFDTNYCVRVLMDDGTSFEVRNLDYDLSKQKFLFYVSACLEFDNQLLVRAVNILRGSKCIKLYQNHTIYERSR